MSRSVAKIPDGMTVGRGFIDISKRDVEILSRESLSASQLIFLGMHVLGHYCEAVSCFNKEQAA